MLYCLSFILIRILFVLENILMVLLNTVWILKYDEHNFVKQKPF